MRYYQALVSRAMFVCRRQVMGYDFILENNVPVLTSPNTFVPTAGCSTFLRACMIFIIVIIAVVALSCIVLGAA